MLHLYLIIEKINALPTPISASERKERILVNKPFTPKYSVANVLINTVRTTNANTSFDSCPPTVKIIFLNELFVLDSVLYIDISYTKHLLNLPNYLSGNS